MECLKLFAYANIFANFICGMTAQKISWDDHDFAGCQTFPFFVGTLGIGHFFVTIVF